MSRYAARRRADGGRSVGARGGDRRQSGRSVRARGTLLALLLCAAGCAACSAVPVLERTPRLGPERGGEDMFALSAAAERAYRESRWIDAARGYQRLAEAVPEDAYAWFRLGNVYTQQGAYARAIHAYETSIARDPEQPRPWFNLSTAYLLHAQAAMRRAWAQLRPGDPARSLIARRLEALRPLVHGRVEDGGTPTGTR